jgi:hypothetical protein
MRIVRITRLGFLAFALLWGAAPRPVLALPVSFELTSSVGGVDLPFTVGQAFRQGDVPSGSNLASSLGTLQVVAKNRWPDGSLKFAIVSGRTTLVANVPGVISLGIGSPTGGAALTTTNLRATGVTAAIGAGTFGSVSWTGTDFDSPFLTWVSGPEMSSWIYRKPIGSDPHLVGWLEVKLYAGGAVEVLPWVENGYLRVAGPTDKNATYTFSLGGTQRFSQSVDLLNHQRMVLASGSTLTHWLGTDPRIVPRHDVAALEASRLVPAYAGVTSSTSTLWGRITQTYTPLAQSDYPTSMGATGYHGSIGPIPEWDVAYLTSQADPRAYRGVIVNGYCAGRYGLHFRDETTNRPPRFSSYPNLVLHASSGVADIGASSTGSYTPAATGPTPPAWKTSHHPSVGFMAYLLTGSFYFMEEIEFSATIGYLKQNDGGPYANRGGSKGILRSDAGANTTRGAAWSLRTLIQAAAITPDGDPLQAEYATSFEENVNYYHGLLIATSNNNPQGVCPPYTDYTTGAPPFMHSIWMEDFLTFAFGYGKDLVSLSGTGSTKLDAFLAWKYQSVVGRFGGGGSNEYCYRDAAVYTMAVSPNDATNFDGADPPGSWYSTWGEIYLATLGHANDCNSGTTLRGSSGASPATFDGYWGNLRPALSYAVDHGAAGASAAYSRLTGASNYATGAATLNDVPVWGVKPRTTGSPSGDTTPPNPPAGLIAR